MTRRERLERRAERRREWAESREAKSTAAVERVHEKGSPITYYRSTREAVHVDCPPEVK
jgi:hypothetical protein